MQKLYIKQKVFKITDHYPILDEDENALYYVDQDFTLIGKTVHVSDRDENEIFVINKKVLTWLPEYHISYANGQEVTIKSNFTFFKDSMNIISQDYELSVKGDFFSHNYKIYKDENLAAEINKVWLSFGDSFELTIYDEKFTDLIIGLCIAIDNIIDDRERSS